MASHKVKPQKASLHILPCTVSQLLSASQVSSDSFAICDWELNQVSVVGIIRGLAPFVTNIQYSVDDMTGPPLNVKQWVNTEDCSPMTFASPGTYVKVTGRLHSFSGQRSLLAMDIRCIKDLNEITSHMLEVVQAHMQFFGKSVFGSWMDTVTLRTASLSWMSELTLDNDGDSACDVNMNTTAASRSGRVLSSGHPEGILPNGLSTIQGQVLNVIRGFSVCDIGISFHDLKTQLNYLSMRDIRTSLTFLINKGHVFCTIDEHHFKSAEY